MNSRRSFLHLGLAGVGALAAAPASLANAPFKRQANPRLLLGLAAYGFRDYLKDASHPRDKQVPEAERIDLFQFIDFCAGHGCAGAELTSYYFPPNPTQEFLLRLKRHAFLAGVDISGTAVGNTFTHPKGPKRDAELALVKTWVDHAAILGAPHIRVFAGDAAGQPHAVAKANCVETLKIALDYAGEKGVFLGIENHGGIVAEPGELLDIIGQIEHPWLGVNLDSGNFHTADPYADFARCAPHAVNVQIKTEIAPKGQRKGPADLAKLVRILREANYQGYVTLEYEAAESPFTAVPRVLKELSALLQS